MTTRRRFLKLIAYTGAAAAAPTIAVKAMEAIAGPLEIDAPPMILTLHTSKGLFLYEIPVDLSENGAISTGAFSITMTESMMLYGAMVTYSGPIRTSMGEFQVEIEKAIDFPMTRTLLISDTVNLNPIRAEEGWS